MFPALTATIYIFRVGLGAEGSEHKSEEYLNLTLLSNASWPTFITMYPASVPQAEHSLSMPCSRSPEAITPIVPTEIKLSKFNPFLSLFSSPAYRLPEPGLKPRVSCPSRAAIKNASKTRLGGGEGRVLGWVAEANKTCESAHFAK